jgi:hypothetical protein
MKKNQYNERFISKDSRIIKTGSSNLKKINLKVTYLTNKQQVLSVSNSISIS